MRKGKILRTLAIVGTCLCAPLLFSGCKKEDDKFHITFMVNGQAYKVYEITENQNITNIPDPVKEGYTFEGWYSDENYENEIEDLAEYLQSNSKANTTLYAKFIVNQYTIAFNTNGGSAVTSITQDYGTTVNKPADPTRDGYTFGGWFTDNGTFVNEYTFTTMPVDGVELYAKWNIETYTITYHLDDGTNGNNQATYTIETNDIELEDATKEGYTFVGWYTEQSYTNKIETIYTNLVQNLNLYAKFTINQYTIVFNTNGGSAVTSITQDYNTSVTKPTDPTRGGYTFGGWFTDNGTFVNEYTFTTMPVDGVELYAKWNIETYTITYHLDDGTNGNNQATYTIETNDIELEDATKEGYTFVGWYTEQSYTNKIETIYTNLVQNLNLYAKFTINQYTIVFNTNGGSAVTSITQDYGTTVTKPANPTKDGYTFGGWFTDNGTFVNEYTFTTMPVNGITLYAKWNEVAVNTSFNIVQTSSNYVCDKLSDVEIKCNSHADCSVSWRYNDTIINDAHEKHMVNHISKNGEVHFAEVDVSAIARLDGKYSFQDMLFTLDNSKHTASVKSNTDTLTRAVIPAWVEYNSVLYTVNKMEYHAFYNIDTLEYAYVPPTIKQYMGTPFAHNDNLTTVDLDKDLTVLSIQMFMYCSSLANITIPENVSKIPLGLFYACMSITNINIPKGVTSIESSAFYGTKLSTIDLPEGLTLIEDYAFSSNKLTHVTIPSTVTTIMDKAFYNNPLVELTILSEEITIGLEAFVYCAGLRNIYLNASNLVNSISSNTQDTSYLLAYLQNNDIIYINENINITSEYIKNMFTESVSDEVGYKAYQFGKYSDMSLTNFENRVYIQNGNLFGDETIKIKNPNNVYESIILTNEMLQNFDTSTIGKKTARIIYKYNEIIYNYYVLPSLDSTLLNCISKVNNFYPTYYVGETVNWNNVSLTYHYNDNGYMKTSIIPVTQSMTQGFDVNTTGVRMITFKNNDSTYELRYYVKNKVTENITSSSFELGQYYDKDTVEETEHFIIKIKKGSYISKNYKEIIEKIYLIEQEVTGLTFAPKITLEVDETNYPSCGRTTLYITPEDLLFTCGTAFIHELAHALDHSQEYKHFSNSVLTEGFASYVEILTAKQLYLSDPITYAYCGTMYDVIKNIDNLGSKIFLYDFEDYILNLDRDELCGNSQYEVGCKMYAYFDYKYGDFCSWMKDSNFYSNSLEDWKTDIKEYYNNSNLFTEMYEDYSKTGDKFNNFIGVEYNTNHTNSIDLTAINKQNYFFNLQYSKNSQGYLSVIYKDLYLNIDSARDQLDKLGIEYQELNLKTDKNINIELYDKNGNLLKTISNTITQFSLAGVSFIKLTGTNNTSLYLTY